MEKLIKYLNQFEEVKAKYWNMFCNWRYIWWRPICTTIRDLNKIVQFSDLLIISKEYEFIKWLVDNDKIEWSKLKRVFYKQNENNTATYPVMSAYSDYECLLMLLSIQDEPIEFLVSILK